MKVAIFGATGNAGNGHEDARTMQCTCIWYHGSSTVLAHTVHSFVAAIATELSRRYIIFAHSI